MKYGAFKYGKGIYGIQGLNLIFDRNENDLKELTSKAYYNYTDLNRIETAIYIISEKLHNMRYCPLIECKTNWSAATSENLSENSPKASDRDRIFENIKILYNNFYIDNDTPQIPENIDRMDIYKANDIERILEDIYIMIFEIIRNERECGTFECGE